MAVQPSESANGILLEGYAVYGIYDPNEIYKQTEIFGLFSNKAKLPTEDTQPEWARKLELSGSFRINGKAYGAFSGSDVSFWLEEGKEHPVTDYLKWISVNHSLALFSKKTVSKHG